MVYPLSSPLPPWREAVGRPEGRQQGSRRGPESFYALVPRPSLKLNRSKKASQNVLIRLLIYPRKLTLLRPLFKPQRTRRIVVGKRGLQAKRYNKPPICVSGAILHFLQGEADPTRAKPDPTSLALPSPSRRLPGSPGTWSWRR